MTEESPADMRGFKPGSVLAGYRLEARVGSGGMAVVYRARDERLRRPVALKILAPQFLSDDAFRRRFIGESLAAAAVDDPHIIPVYGAGEADGVLFIAMRFVNGGDLRLLLNREGVLSPAQAADIVSPVASALDAAHNAGLVHRDVKPGNVLVDTGPGRPDHVYLSDFGISKSASAVTLTGTGQFFGTPGYSAPEQVEGRNDVDGRADQYALACVTYELLTAQTPFQHRSGMMSMLIAHVHEPPPALNSRNANLPGAANDVMAKALAKNPDDRYATCADFADALRDALDLPPYHAHRRPTARAHDETSVATPTPPGLRTPTEVSLPPAPPSDEPSAPPAADTPEAVHPETAVLEVAAPQTAIAEPVVPAEPDAEPDAAGTEDEAAQEWPETVAVQPQAPELPEPAQPEPDLLDQAELPEPQVPEPRQPVEPEPAEPAPGTPEPATPQPATSQPATPEPATPEPATAAALGPAPAPNDATAAGEPEPVAPGTLVAGPATEAAEPPNAGTLALTATLRMQEGNGDTVQGATGSAATQVVDRPGTQVDHGPGGPAAGPGSGGLRRRLPVIAAGVVLIAAVAGILPFVLKSPAKSPAPPPSPTTSATTSASATASPGHPTATASPGTLTFHATRLGLPADFQSNVITSLAFNPASSQSNPTLAVGGTGVCLWDVTAARCAAQFGPATAVAFNSAGTTLVASDSTGASLNPAIRLVDVPAGKQLFYDQNINDSGIPSSGVNSVAFSHDNKTVAVGDLDGIIYLWSAVTKKTVTHFQDPTGVNAVAFTPDGKVLATGDGSGTTYLWNVVTGRVIAPLTAIQNEDINSMGVASLAVSPDGKTLAVAEDSGNVRGIFLWDIATRKLMTASPFTDPNGAGVTSVAFSHTGATLAVGDRNGFAYLWNIATRKMTAALHDPEGRAVAEVAFSPSGDTVATGDEGGSVYVWSAS